MDDTPIASVDASPVPTNQVARPAWIRWLALLGFVVSVMVLGWTWWKLEQRRGLVESDIPPLLFGGVVGLATTVLAAMSLRGASLRLRVALILLGLFTLATAAWDLFTAWIIAIFPPC